MGKYVLKRLLLIFPVLIGITLITFAIIHLTPGGYTSVNMQMNIKVSPDSVARLKTLYGLDKPLHTQYLDWVSRVLRFDFGTSFIDQRPVMDKIYERLPATLLLNLISLVLIFIVGIGIGVASAVKNGGTFDKVMSVITFIGYSLPSFWLALLLMILFGVVLRWLPVSGMVSLGFDYMSPMQKIGDLILHLILPVFVTAFGGLAYISRYVKSSMVETLSQYYIKAAYAKGMPEKTVIYKSALKNSLLPVITLLGLSLPGLIGGSFIFETIFSWPGMGRLAYESALSFDYPVIMGVATIAAFLTLLGNLIADIAYALVDPRIRYR
ncbi:MAG: ABC transporter permease [bacterium]